MIYIIFVILVVLKLSASSSSNSWPTFQYYSSYGASPQTLNITGSVQNLKPYTSSKQIIFVVHGFNVDPSAPHIVAVRDALLKNTQSNVFIVDWAIGADTGLNYEKAGINSIIAGKSIYQFMLNNNIAPASVYCIGHSLGAHACGSAGNSSSGKLARITGLDPAGPWFGQGDELYSSRLVKEDATFVDVIHTNPGLYGTKVSSGHQDFFVNYNGLFTFQPGCNILNIFNIANEIPCSHRASCYLYANSTLASCTFNASLCAKQTYDDDGNFHGCTAINPNVKTVMGYFASMNSPNGNYTITTDEKYCGNS